MCDQIIDEVAVDRVLRGNPTRLTEAERQYIVDLALPAWEAFVAEQRSDDGYGRHYDGTHVRGDRWRDPEWMLLLAEGLGIKTASLKSLLDRHRKRLAKAA